MPDRKPKPSSKPEEEKMPKKVVKIVDKVITASENVVAVDTER